MEIIIVPAWRRPAFLLATLRRLSITVEGREGVQIWVALDRRPDPVTAHIAHDYTRKTQHARLIERRHPYRGNSYNVLQTYREAVNAHPSLIHLVEEDVFVSADYLDFHHAAHELAPDAFAVSAARNQNHPGDPAPDPTALYRGREYQSIAVSFKPERLVPVLAHSNPAYFSNPIKYVTRHFPRSRIPRGNAEQDGLINRVVEQSHGAVIYPALPRAYHAGFVGYHRKGESLAGTIEQQADRLLAMTTEEMNAAAHSYPDHQVVDLDARPGAPTQMIVWP